MKNIIIISIIALFIFVSCSKKEFNAGVDSITSDVTKKFDSGVDHSERPE